MEPFNDILGFIFLGTVSVIGVIIVIKAIYGRFFRCSEPDSKIWCRAKAVVVGEFTYSKRSISYKRDVTVDITEPLIVYYADGKEYRRSVPYNTGGKELTIYYKRRDPSFFRTEEEIVLSYKNGRKNSTFFFMLFIGLITAMLAGILFVDIYFI